MAGELIVVVGVPPEIEQPFRARFSKITSADGFQLKLVSTYHLHEPYTDEYARDLYDELVVMLKGLGSASRESLLAQTKLILLLLQKPDASHALLVDRFGIEAFVAPMQPDVFDLPLATGGQRGRAAGLTVRAARRAIRHGRKMLFAIDEELNGRENKTCLLLPPKTFGKDFRSVLNRVQKATTTREDTVSFIRGLKGLSLGRQSGYYQGDGGLVFKSPSKSGPRHGLAPIWKDQHEPSCVLRGRLRFGVSYAPNFHYDCRLPPHRGRRRFPGCHSPYVLPSHKTHANVAPNDGVR